MDFRDLIPFGRDRGNVPVQRDRGEHPMDTFQREFNRLFDDFFRTPTMFGRGGEAFASMPRVDVSESEGEYGVIAELPTADGQAARPGLNASTARGRAHRSAQARGADRARARHSFLYGRPSCPRDPGAREAEPLEVDHGSDPGPLALIPERAITRLASCVTQG